MTFLVKFWGGYNNEPSIFDDISQDDIILAFFPCTRFETKIELGFRGEQFQQKNWSDIQKLEYSMQLHEELHEFYLLISKLAAIAIKRNLKLIIENSKSTPHYLTRYWCLKPKLVDSDRTLNGDYYRKPTQFWFINCEPKNNIIFEPIDFVETTLIDKGIKINGVSKKTARSMIHPQYANRFIRQFILEQEN